ncbi:MAG: hypothetical protein L0220_14175 [Acidobacteria bacterium]|nr:hypothetical protein [Acidobacteriota bacterium]
MDKVDVVIGHNFLGFDAELIESVWGFKALPHIPIYDTLTEMVRARGGDPDRPGAFRGLSLDAISRANFDVGKSEVGRGRTLRQPGNGSNMPRS